MKLKEILVIVLVNVVGFGVNWEVVFVDKEGNILVFEYIVYNFLYLISNIGLVIEVKFF